jgi:glucose/arabinose dehydrogenase
LVAYGEVAESPVDNWPDLWHPVLGKSSGLARIWDTGIGSFMIDHTAAEGWRYTLLATGLSKPRTVLFDTEGHLLVLEAGKGLTAHTIGADGCITASKTVIENVQLNHGLALSPDGKTVYVSAMPTAWSYSYDATNMTATGQTVVIRGMNPSGHKARTLAVPPNNPNLLIVSLGSEGNIDGPAIMKETGRAIVKVFDLSKAPSGGYTYNTQGWYLGYRLRNEVGIIFDGNNMSIHQRFVDFMVETVD